jgi:hypothetical protein
MKPKDKAKELIYKFYPSVQWKLGQENCLDRAKQCALMAVDEILKALTNYDMDINCDYWQKVKQEIENNGGDK